MELTTRFITLLIIALLAFNANGRVIHDNDDVDTNDVEKTVVEQDEYDSDVYNRWVEQILGSFSTKMDVCESASDRILLSVTSSLVSKAASFDVETAIDDAFVSQCGNEKYRQKMRHISEIVSAQNHCLMDAKRKLARHFRQTSSSDGHSVRDTVFSQLACNVVPEILECFEPTLELLLSCTDDVTVGFPIYKEFKEALLQQYCEAGDVGVVADLMSEAPAGCISVGMDYYLKFLGPSFIKKMPIVSAIEYPCAISQYIRQMSTVMLPMQCQASSLVKLITHYSHKFNKEIGCLELFSR